MSRITTTSLLLSAVLAAPGCLLTPEVIGETLTSLGSGESDDTFGESTTTTGEGGGSSTTAADSTGATTGPSAYGSYCELIDPPHPLVSPVPSSQPACDGGICVLVKEAPLACLDDDVCVQEKGEGSVCDGDGWCTETPAFLAENTRCTQTCETVADCPPIPGCMTGVTCAPATFLTELCCQKMCLCNDHLFIPGVEDNQQICDGDPELCS